MSVVRTIGGVAYPLPEPGETGPLQDQQVLNYLLAIPAGFIQIAGGLNALLATLDLGPNFGVKALYYASRAAQLPLGGDFRLGYGEWLATRNSGNTADETIGWQTVGASPNVLAYGLSTGGAAPVINGLISGAPYAEYVNNVTSLVSGTAAQLNYNTMVQDTDLAVTTGATWKFTVPTGKPGVYAVSANNTYGSIAAAGIYALLLYKNGVEVHALFNQGLAVNANPFTLSGATEVPCAAGDTLAVYGYQTSGGALTPDSNGNSRNRITIQYVRSLT